MEDLNISECLDDDLMDSLIFSRDRPRKWGPKSFLNQNYLPQLSTYVLSHLSVDERSQINEYVMQNFIMEITVLKGKINDISVLKDFIVAELRSFQKYWIEGSEIFCKFDEIAKENEEEEEFKKQEEKVVDEKIIEAVQQYSVYLQEVNSVKKNYEIIPEESPYNQVKNSKEEEKINNILGNIKILNSFEHIDKLFYHPGSKFYP